MDFPDKRPIIGVMGSGSEAHKDKSVRLGEWIALAGYHLLSGGGSGVMAAVSESFYNTKKRPGLSIGIIPGKIIDGRYNPLPGYPNPYVEIPVYTHLPLSGSEGTSQLSRNHINILSAHVIVVLPGGEGTKSEIRLAGTYGKPVIGFFNDPVAAFGENIRIECTGNFEILTKRIKEILNND